MSRRKQKNSKKSRASASSKAILTNQSQTRQFDSREIEENEASFSHFTGKIQKQPYLKKESLIEKNPSNKEANASRPAVHLKRDEPSDDEYEPRGREVNQNKENLDELDCTNAWGNPKGIVKKIHKTNSQGNINSQRTQQIQVLEQKPQQRKRESYQVNGGFLRQGLENLGNTCFCNALFQCLFDVTQFRDSILRTSKSKNQGVLLRSLCNFFHNLEQRSHNTQRSYSHFVRTLFNKRKDQFQIGTQGDSCILFRALLEELAKEGRSEDLPYLRIFRGGDLIKTIECSGCHEKKIITEKLKILDVKDVNFYKENKENFFQSTSELRVCWNCRVKGMFICQYEVTGFPEILVIKVHETMNREEKAKVIPLLEFERENLGNVRYGLGSAVVNELRGEKGDHSMELSSQNGGYFLVDDHREIVKVKLEGLKPNPKLLFYKKV